MFAIYIGIAISCQLRLYIDDDRHHVVSRFLVRMMICKYVLFIFLSSHNGVDGLVMVIVVVGLY